MFGVATQNGVGVGTGNIPALSSLPYATTLYLAVLNLFSSGAQGAFLDANDWGPTGTGGMGVCFQDLGGTPVAAMEQPIQLILDKSQGLARGAERVTNGDLTNGTTGWGNSGASTFSVASFGGKSTALHIVAGSAGGAGTYQNVTPVGKAYYITFDLYVVSGAVYGGVSTNKFKGGNFTTGAWTTVSGVYFSTDAAFRFYGVSIGDEFYVTNFSCKQIAGNHAYVSASANRPVITCRYNLLLATAALSTQSVTVGAGSYTLYFTGSGSVALSGAATGTKTAGSNVITCTAGTLTLTVTGSVLTADLRPSDQATGLIPTYQRVNTATDYDTVGFPVRESYNGSNQLLGGASGGGATTGFFFCAGVMITKVGAAQTLFSDTGTNTGWRVRINASNQLELSAGNGTTYTTVATVGTVSINKLTVVTAWHDGTNLNVQINQGAVAQAAFAVATAGTAGYTLACDNGASTNYLQGSLGEIVYRTGTAMTAAQIASTQAFVNSKQKAY